jgi:hypothetical protein
MLAIDSMHATVTRPSRVLSRDNPINRQRLGLDTLNVLSYALASGRSDIAARRPV